MSKKSGENNAVTVCVRIRPQNAAEKAAKMAVVMKPTVSESLYLASSLLLYLL